MSNWSLKHLLRVMTVLACAAFMVGCEPTAPARATSPASSTAPASAAAAPPAANATPEQRDTLYELAFQVASAIPADPHYRDKARMQEQVALACLDQGLLDHATRLARGIKGWRQAEVYALAAEQYALQANKDGKQDGAKLLRAKELVERAKDMVGTDETSGRVIVNTQIARVLATLGDASGALAALPQDSPTERGLMEVARTRTLKVEQLDAQANAFDAAIATLNFDLARGGLDGYLIWLERVKGDAPRYERGVKAYTAGTRGLPMDLQVVYYAQLAELLCKHGNAQEAAQVLSGAANILNTTVFQAEDVAPLGAKLIKVRVSCGDSTSARADLKWVRDNYESRKSEIVDLRRANCLRAMAEAALLLGDRDEAMRSYAAALEEGARNVNARPRAMDLCATVTAMARQGVVPTPEMTLRIQAIRNGLTDPW